MKKESVPTIRDLYPHLNEEELAQAEDQLERYLALVLRIFERVEVEDHPLLDQLTQNAGAIRCEGREESPQ